MLAEQQVLKVMQDKQEIQEPKVLAEQQVLKVTQDKQEIQEPKDKQEI